MQIVICMLMFNFGIAETNLYRLKLVSQEHIYIVHMHGKVEVYTNEENLYYTHVCNSWACLYRERLLAISFLGISSQAKALGVSWQPSLSNYLTV